MKKIQKLFITSSSIMFTTLPIVSVVSCKQSQQFAIELTSDSMSFVEGNSVDTLKALFNPESTDPSVVHIPTTPLPVSADYQTNSAYEEITPEYRIYLVNDDRNIAQANSTEFYGTSKDSLLANLLLINKSIKPYIDKGYADYLSTNSISSPNEQTFADFMNTVKMRTEINKQYNYFAIQLYGYDSSNTILGKWINDYFSDPVFGIKSDTTTPGLTYQIMGGGGIFTYYGFKDEYHLDGNYLSSSDPEREWLNNWNGQPGILYSQDPANPTSLVQSADNRGIYAFALSPNGEHNIYIETVSRIDMDNSKLYVDVTFTRGGIPLEGRIEGSTFQGVPRIMEFGEHTFLEPQIKKSYELVGAIRGDESARPDYNSGTVKADFKADVETIVNVYDAFKGLLTEQSPLIKIQPELQVPLGVVRDIFDEMKTKNLIYKDNNGTPLNLFDDSLRVNQQFLDDLYVEVCTNPKISLDAISTASPQFSHISIQMITSFSTQQLTDLIGIIISLYNMKDFVDNYATLHLP